ncbi:MAG: DUF2461 domain-containing protein [Clostridia bacterium]|nr:DUF2461 domain-containing protein [Clostridia bacterium]MCQ2479406.1 DUF2461 domain-containing protein [Clostridia bacterium]
MAFNGISAEAMWLLAQNRFENSKPFYEEHKEEIKKSVIIPMRQIAGELSPLMYEIDDMMNLDPVRMVSRVRRDNRYTHDKHLYRDNLWVMFMRPKKEWETHPCMWFEVRQEFFSYGVGGFYMPPALMAIYRRHLIEREQEFLDAVKSARKIGAAFSGECYKKPKPGNPSPAVLPYYNVKYLSFMVTRNDFETLTTPKLIEELEEAYKALAPMYKFLKEISDEYVATQGGKL